VPSVQATQGAESASAELAVPLDSLENLRLVLALLKERPKSS
jgi:hypothetical protein